jgi:hypothetical protein
MSLVFRIDSVHFDKSIHPEQEKHAAWLQEKNLKDHYGNLKTKPEKDGFSIYKQRSKSGKVDISQQVRVQL